MASNRFFYTLTQHEYNRQQKIMRNYELSCILRIFNQSDLVPADMSHRKELAQFALECNRVSDKIERDKQKAITNKYHPLFSAYLNDRQPSPADITDRIRRAAAMKQPFHASIMAFKERFEHIQHVYESLLERYKNDPDYSMYQAAAHDAKRLAMRQVKHEFESTPEIMELVWIADHWTIPAYPELKLPDAANLLRHEIATIKKLLLKSLQDNYNPYSLHYAQEAIFKLLASMTTYHTSFILPAKQALIDTIKQRCLEGNPVDLLTASEFSRSSAGYKQLILQLIQKLTPWNAQLHSPLSHDDFSMTQFQLMAPLYRAMMLFATTPLAYPLFRITNDLKIKLHNILALLKTNHLSNEAVRAMMRDIEKITIETEKVATVYLSNADLSQKSLCLTQFMQLLRNVPLLQAPVSSPLIHNTHLSPPAL